MVFWMMVGVAGLLFLVTLAILLATKAWKVGVISGRKEATELLDSSLMMLAKRVDERQVVTGAPETVPQDFKQKMDQEVIEWAESVVSKWRSLKRAL